MTIPFITRFTMVITWSFTMDLKDSVIKGLTTLYFQKYPTFHFILFKYSIRFILFPTMWYVHTEKAQALIHGQHI